MNLLKNGNIALAFLLELFSLIILGYWGFTLQADKGIRISIGILAPILMMSIWSIWCAPSSAHRLEGLWLLLIKCLLFGVVAYCLFRMNYPLAAIIFSTATLLNLALSSYFGTL